MCARIKMIELDRAEGRLKELYTRYKGNMANILKVHSLHPSSLEAHLAYYRSIMFSKSPISRKTREIIATVVSSLNDCFY